MPEPPPRSRSSRSPPPSHGPNVQSGDGSRKRRRDGADQNVVVSNVRKFMSDYAFEFVIIHELQQTFGNCHRSMPRVLPVAKAFGAASGITYSFGTGRFA